MTVKNNRIPLFCIVTSIYWFSLYAYVPILPTYAGSLGASYKMIGLIIGSYGFAQIVLRIPLGIFSDKLNRRKLFISLGIILSLISSLGLWYFTSTETVLVFRTLSGAAAASWVPFTVLFSTYYKSGEAPKAIGLINSFNSVGQMAAVFLGGITAQSFGPRSTFLLGSIGAVVALALSAGIAEKKTVLREPVKTAELLTVAKDRYFLMICLLSIFSQFITFSTVFAFTPIAAKNLGADSFQLGLLTSLSILPGIFASVLSGSFFVKRYGERKTIIWGFIIIALSCIVIPWIKDINLLYATQFIGGFGRGIVFPVLMGLSIKNIHDSKRATAMGFFQATYSIGMFLGPVVTGVLNDMAGLDWGFRIIGMIAITGAFIIARKPSRHESNGYI